MRDHRYYMDLALAEARKAVEYGEVPVGAVVVGEEGALLGTGWNRPRTDTDPTAHAEIVALREAARARRNYRLIGCTVYVTIEPCIMCVGALIHARVKRLVYGAPDIRFGAVESLHRILYDDRINHRIEVLAGIGEAECRRLMQTFFRNRRREKNDTPGASS